MKSIPTIYVRDKATRELVNKPFRLIDWVFQGKGIATRKYDGVAILVDNGKVFRRFEWRGGNKADKTLLNMIRLADFDPKRPDALIPFWAPVSPTVFTSPRGPDEKALKEAWEWLLKDLRQVAFNNKKEAKMVNPYAPLEKEEIPYPNGTYELCGPSIHGNHEGLEHHMLLKHGAEVVKEVPRSFEKLKKFLETYEGEGIVWHYKVDGIERMAKVKKRDFAISWPKLKIEEKTTTTTGG